MIPSGKILLALLLATTATAQHWVGVRAGMINHAEGVFYIDQERLQFPDARFREIPRGASLRTGTGWVEVQLGPNAFLWMGEEGALRIEDPILTNIQLRVERGSVVIEVSEQAKGSKFTILFGNTVIKPRQPGLYRLDSAQSQLSVYAGKAEIRLAGKKATVKRGKAALLTGDLRVSRFDVQQLDTLQENAAHRSRILSGVIQEARMRAEGVPMVAQQRWYEARGIQRRNEQLQDVNPQEGTNQSQNIKMPESWPGQQEGHPSYTPPQMQQGMQDAIDKARSGQTQPPPQQ